MMIRKLTIALFLAVAMLATAAATSAQTAELRGHVFLKKADGTKAPVEGAVIDIYRTDIKGIQQVKSRKDGSFVHAGLMFAGTYLLSVSAPGASPKAQGNVRPGHGQDYEFELDPGDGHVMTEADAKTAANGAASTEGETAEQRAAREADEAKRAAIVASNAKATNSNQIVNDSFNNGNKFVLAGLALGKNSQFLEAIAQYDQAIVKYDEGIAADPDHPGISSLLTNKSVALYERGRNHYNAGVTATVPADKTAQSTAAKKDFEQAIEVGKKAVALLAAAAPDVQAGPNYQKNKVEALKAVAIAYKFTVTNIDPSLGADGAKAYDAYIEATPDATAKAALVSERAKLIFDSGDFATAAVEYQKLLAASPDNLDHMYWLGLALISQEDKAKAQEGVNQLQAFVDKAPDTDTRKAAIRDTIEEIKKEQHVTPQKPTSPRRRGN
jgi:tetratricopeptide (TPR) repeat protein